MRARAIPTFVSLCVVLLPAATTRAADADVMLESNGLVIRVDRTTGNLLGLTYAPVGVVLDAQPGNGGMVDVAYPMAEAPVLRLASGFSRAEVIRDSDGLVIRWDTLAPSRTRYTLPEGRVSAEVRIRKAPDGRSTVLSCRVENHSSAPVPQVVFPDLRGLAPFDGVEATRLRLARDVMSPFVESTSGPRNAALFYAYRRWKEYAPRGYYESNALRWLDYGSLKGGLSVFEKRWGHPAVPIVRTHRSEADPTRFRLLWEHRTRIEPGESWESAEFWLTPHPGGWAKGIEAYRAFVDQVNPPRKVPAHVRDGLGYQTIWMIQTAETDPDRAAFKFSDLPRVARDAKEHGIHEIVPWGWCVYSSMPIPVRPELGTKQDFLNALGECRRLGVNIAPFISLQIVRNMYAARYGATPGNADYTYHMELIPNLRPHYTKFWDGASVSSENPVWKQDAENALNAWIDAGLASFCWDVYSVKMKEKGVPDLIALTQRVRERALARDPESTFSAESVTNGLEVESAVVDYTWNWVEYLDAGPLLNIYRTPRFNCNVEDSVLDVKRGFCEGLYLNVMPVKPDQPNGTALIGDIPHLSAAVKQARGLRRQFLPFFVEGHALGESVLHRPASAFVRAHQLGNRLFIAVLNDREQAQSVSLQSRLELWLPRARGYSVQYYDDSGRLLHSGEFSSPMWHGTTDRLAPLTMAFYVIEAH